MTTEYKLAQIQGTASVSTYATLYETAAATSAVISTIMICNTAATSATYRVAVMGSAGTPLAGNWIVYDSVVFPNDTLGLSFGLAMGNDKFMRVSSSADTVTFSASVAEIS